MSTEGNIRCQLTHQTLTHYFGQGHRAFYCRFRDHCCCSKLSIRHSKRHVVGVRTYSYGPRHDAHCHHCCSRRGHYLPAKTAERSGSIWISFIQHYLRDPYTHDQHRVLVKQTHQLTSNKLVYRSITPYDGFQTTATSEKERHKPRILTGA